MAKEKLRQKRIEGTFDPINEEVQQAAHEYVDALVERMQLQEQENTLRRELLEAMREHDVHECEIDGYTVTRVAEEVERVKVKKHKEVAADA